MIIHKQGIKIIVFFVVLLTIINFLVIHFLPEKKILKITVNIISILVLTQLLIFFRNPKRKVIENDAFVFSPADGKVVVVEKVKDPEYFDDERIQISVYMNIFNVHKNWIPISGKVSYLKYHKGKYLMAHNPKSSTMNERNSVVIKTDKNSEILVRQIAGLIARRIVCNVTTNEIVKQDNELGFIKFGSRLDVFLPLNSKINVKLGDKVVGGLTVLADLIYE